MKDATLLHDFFKGSKTLFYIPLYQRKYAWQTKHCERLLKDLKRILTTDVDNHFFGSIVSTHINSTFDLLIIDGQQRLTTISLLVLAGINAVKDGNFSLGNQQINDIKNNYLYAELHPENNKVKLRLTEDDRWAYEHLLSNDEETFIEGSAITENYRFFYKRLVDDHDLSLERVMEAIDKLIVIDICLDEHDNPQLIFESLNSCGKDLEEADKVRNFLLMDLSKQDQERYYTSYWHKIEGYTGVNLTSFISDYLIIKTGTLPHQKELYFEFKDYVEEHSHSITREELLQDICRFAEYYNILLCGNIHDEKLKRKLKQIANIGTLIHMPYLLSFYSYAQEQPFSTQEIYAVLDVIENYWARRIICDYPSNALRAIFATLHSTIINMYTRGEQYGHPIKEPYIELLKEELLKKGGKDVFPRDDEIKKYFVIRNVYALSDYKFFLFERMENGNSKQYDASLVEKMRTKNITIEHIMPQTLSPQWKEDLGSDWEGIQEKYLHTFANLTLTGYNTELGNRTFAEKKEGYDYKGKHIDGYKDTLFHLSQTLDKYPRWTQMEIEARGKELLDKFFKLWPMITSSYVPTDKSDKYSLLDDGQKLTGRKLIAYIYNDVRHECTKWVEMLKQICQLLYKKYPNEMIALAKQGTGEFSPVMRTFSTTGQERDVWIGEQCYVLSVCSNSAKHTILRHLFEQCHLPLDSLLFEIAPMRHTDTEDDTDDIEEENTLF